MVIKNTLCAVCGGKIEMSYDDEPFTDEANFENYSKFKRIIINRCPYCNYCSENPSIQVPEKVKELISSKSYFKTLNYEFMGEYKELPDKEYLDLNLNELEAYAMVCKELNNNLMVARVLGRIADLKYLLANTYLETKYMKDDEELNDSYDKIIESLFEQAQINNEECLNFLRGTKISDTFSKIFVAERLCFNGFYNQGKSIIDKLRKKVTFTKDLSKYVDNFLTEVEQI